MNRRLRTYRRLVAEQATMGHAMQVAGGSAVLDYVATPYPRSITAADAPAA
jgi:hypothetical protein